MQSVLLNNIGFLQSTVPDDIFDILVRSSRIAKEENCLAKNTLAGNLEESYDIHLGDSDLDEVQRYLLNICSRYERQSELMRFQRSVMHNNYALRLEKIWVNYQKKYEYNPIHTHSGIYSFVIWVKIPYNFRQEYKQNSCKNSNTKCAGTFAFYYPNVLGEMEEHKIELDQTYEKQIIVFPAKLNHMVYPFYTSDDYRISISGNIFLHVL